MYIDSPALYGLTVPGASIALWISKKKMKKSERKSEGLPRGRYYPKAD